MIELKVSSSMC